MDQTQLDSFISRLCFKSLEDLQLQLLSWARTNPRFNEPFFDISANDIGMILLQVVQARAKVHHSAVLKLLRKTRSESWRYQSAWISHEEQLWVGRAR